MFHVNSDPAFITPFRSSLISSCVGLILLGYLCAFAATGCDRNNDAIQLKPPDVLADARAVSADALTLDASKVQPMYRALLPVDLYTVIRTAAADNVDIKLARYRVEQSQGRYEHTVGGAFPVLVPTALFEHVDGSVRATEGNIVNVGFNTFQPSIAVQWVINPGRVIYEIIASKKRLRAAEYQEDAVQMETLRTAAVQFYTLVLSQARVAAADQAVVEAHELLRINRLRSTTGAGVPADELRAEARLAERRQDL
ncbi:MAG: TolC family protein, partial [Phycisphaerae bacterium]